MFISWARVHYFSDSDRNLYVKVLIFSLFCISFVKLLQTLFTCLGVFYFEKFEQYNHPLVYVKRSGRYSIFSFMWTHDCNAYFLAGKCTFLKRCLIRANRDIWKVPGIVFFFREDSDNFMN